MKPMPHLMPLLQPGEMRVTITVSPQGETGQAAINVTPENVPDGWPQVIRFCCVAIEVAVQQMTQPPPRIELPRILLPGTGEML